MNNLMLAVIVLLSSCTMSVRNDELDMRIAKDCIQECTNVAETCLYKAYAGHRVHAQQLARVCLNTNVECVANCVDEYLETRSAR